MWCIPLYSLSLNLFSASKIYFHAPFNFSFKKKGDEWLNYLQNNISFGKDFFFVVHYKNPFYEFLKDLKIYSSKYPSINILFENPAEYILNEYQFDEILRNCSGLCLDTCHLFGSGIEFIPFVKRYQERIKLFHLNDSKNEFGSGIDRHENIFKGFIFGGRDSETKRQKNELLEYIFSLGIDIILETPDSQNDFKVLKKMFPLSTLGITGELVFEKLNEPITQLLLKESNELKGSINKYKKAALIRGADIIENLPFVIKNEQDLNGIKGIGEGIKDRVKDFLSFAKNDSSSSPSYDIKTSYHLQDVSSKVSLQVIKNVFKPFFKKYFIRSIITGSYRRGLKEVRDIDLIVFDDIDFVIETINKKFDVQKIISKGTKKCSLIIKYKSAKEKETFYQIDVIKTTIKSYPFALLYFTGNKYFNIKMRKTASEKGFKLNEYGLFSLGGKAKTPIIRTEKDIFSFLDQKYLKPSERSF